MEIIRIDNLEIPQLDVYSRIPEVQLKHMYEPQPGLFIAESPVVIERAISADYEAVSVLTDDVHLEKMKEILERCNVSVPIYVATEKVLSEIKGFEMTRGALCAVRRKELISIRDICRGKKNVAILEEIVNPTNVGAIFRSAAAMGVEAVILTFGCADPLYRRAVRVSMGNVFLVPWTMAHPKDDVLAILKDEGFTALAMSLDEDSLKIDDPLVHGHEKQAIILGTESEGLKEETLRDCDYKVMIPMADGVDSLNVAAASAVAFWELSM